MWVSNTLDAYDTNTDSQTATGLISEWFAIDLLVPSWPGKQAIHKITAIGSSSAQKGHDFVTKHIKPNLAANDSPPTVYGSYQEVYTDDTVDCVYIGTPHSFHRQNCLDAIAAGKNVLCEKPFCMNAAETAEVLAAAKAKGVFIMEAVWTRFFPLVREMQRLLHEEQVIGTIQRTFCDFALGIGDIDALPARSRYRDPKLGAGSLLDIGIYSLLWGLLTLDAGVGETAQEPEVVSKQSLQSGVDTASSLILFYPKTGRQGILTCTTNVQSLTDDWCRVEGSKGTLIVSGGAPSVPGYFTIKMHGEKEDKRFDFDRPGRGYFWMADAVAMDIHQGKTQDDLMPWRETERVMEIMDGVRQRGGAKFDVDRW